MPEATNYPGSSRESSSPGSDDANEQTIEGGDVTDLDEPYEFFNKEKHEATTARRLAYLFVGALAGFFVLHYTATFAAALWLEPQMQDVLQDIFHAGLPVLSGLAGAAATYFFIRRD